MTLVLVGAALNPAPLRISEWRSPWSFPPLPIPAAFYVMAGSVAQAERWVAAHGLRRATVLGRPVDLRGAPRDAVALKVGTWRGCDDLTEIDERLARAGIPVIDMTSCAAVVDSSRTTRRPGQQTRRRHPGRRRAPGPSAGDGHRG